MFSCAGLFNLFASLELSLLRLLPIFLFFFYPLRKRHSPIAFLFFEWNKQNYFFLFIYCLITCVHIDATLIAWCSRIYGQYSVLSQAGVWHQASVTPWPLLADATDHSGLQMHTWGATWGLFCNDINSSAYMYMRWRAAWKAPLRIFRALCNTCCALLLTKLSRKNRWGAIFYI